MPIKDPDKGYKLHLPLWEQIRATIKGKYAVIDIVSCLPAPQYRVKPTNMSLVDNRINAYWSRGRLFSATARTHEALGGMVWTQDPEEEIPSNLDYLEENADGQGSGLREVAQKVVDELISVGRYGLLSDMPKASIDESGKRKKLTVEQMSMQGPRIIQYKAEQIIYVRCSSGSVDIDEVRLLETKMEQDPDDQFNWKEKEYIRRLILIDGIYHNQLWDDIDKKTPIMMEDVAPIANGKVMDFIPFQFFGSDDNSPSYSKPPLYDLANVNLGHFVLDCDNRDNLHYHGQGMTVVKTAMSPDEFNLANPNGLDVGAKGMNQLGQGDAVELLQIDATGAIPSEMLRDQDRMVSLGAQLVTDSSTAETLGAKRIDSNANTSTLKRISRNASLGIKNVLQWCADFLGVKGEIKYRLNDKFFTDDVTPQMLQAHMQLIQGSLLPVSSIYETARKAGLTTLTDEEIEEETAEDDLTVETMSKDDATEQAKLDAEQMNAE